MYYSLRKSGCLVERLYFFSRLVVDVLFCASLVRLVWLKLAEIFQRNDIVQILSFLFTIFIVVNPFLSVAVNDSLAQQFDGFISNLTFTSPLLHGL